ncbi:hypothetical protein MTR_4g052640 [Medicago truncatula]|uniref:Uncharacterized protein n=1 Tax=Medicago truncatula TaxID=3880 RepID=A0A072UKB7_MEDTR|nr:hypothetical protein MTR_4g052640 [Medicago truncatula]
MRPLGRSNFVSCQAAPVDRMMILTCRVYTIFVDLGLSLRWLTAPAHRILIFTCGVLLIQRFYSVLVMSPPKYLLLWSTPF